MLYLAYGSNMNLVQMHHRCPAAVPVGKLMLPDYRLVFRRVADIEEAPGATVPAVVWRVTPECEVALDRYEGVKSRIYRREFITLPPSARFGLAGQTALVYRMNSDDYELPPNAYLHTIADGYDDFGFSTSRLFRAVRFTCSQLETAIKEAVNV